MQEETPEKVTWYKTKRKREDDSDQHQHSSPGKRMRGEGPGNRECSEEGTKTRTEMQNGQEPQREQVKAVMFVPYTVGTSNDI